MSLLFANNAASLLDAGISETDVNIPLAAGTGSLFPAPANGDVCYVTIFNNQLSEVIKLTGRNGDSLTVVRGQDNTIARAWSKYDRVELRLPNVALQQFVQKTDIGTTVQAQNANLQAISGLASSADQLPYFNGAGTAALTTLSTYGRSLIAAATLVAAQAVLGLGTAAAKNTTDFLQPANNLSEVASAATARANLGLGSAATMASSAFLQPGNNLSDVQSIVTARANLGLASLAMQAASAVAITGGTINGTVIGGTTPAAITGTTGTFAQVIGKTLNGQIVGSVDNTGGRDFGIFGDTSAVTFGSMDSSKGLRYSQVTGNFTQLGSGTFALTGRLLASGVTDDGSTGLQATTARFTGDIQQANAAYLRGKTAAGITTRLIGVNSGNTLYIGGIDTSLTGGIMLVNNGVTQAQWVGGRTLLNGVTDDGSSGLQGSTAKFSGGLVTGASGIQVGASLHSFTDQGTYAQLQSFNGQPLTLNPLGNIVLVGTHTPNGSDLLQVAGNGRLIGDLTAQNHLNVYQVMRAMGGNSPTTGAGTEIAYAGGVGYISAFDRDNGAWKPLSLNNGGPTLIRTDIWDGVSALQVSGSASFGSDVTINNNSLLRFPFAGGLGYVGLGSNLVSNGGTSDIAIRSDAGAVLFSAGGYAGSGRITSQGRWIIGSQAVPDNGTDLLQVSGSATFGNNAIKAAQFTFMNGFALTQINGGTMGVAGCHFAPGADGTANLGLAGNRWLNLYLVNQPTVTSDVRLKTFTGPSLGLDFINRLETHTGYWTEKGAADGLHQWLSAQQVEATLIGMGVKSFAGLSKPDNAPMGLQYSEFIAPLIKSVQELSHRVKQLEQKEIA